MDGRKSQGAYHSVMSRRDDFTAATIATLAKRVGYLCSNPQCRDRTSGPHSHDDKSVILGEAAHISAASPGGTRYDATMTVEARKSTSNGIWLCRKCARLIDVDGNRFSIELLQAWKTIAESHAREALEPQAASGGPDIDFEVRTWKTWQTRGSLQSDNFVVVSGYGHGDIQYQGQLYLRNNTKTQQLLTACVLQFHAGAEAIFTDEYAFRRQDVTLPVGEWFSVYFNGGLHLPDGPGIYTQADSIFLSCEQIGFGPKLWQVAAIRGDAASLEEI